MSTRYLPGPYLAAVTPCGAVVFGSGVPSALVVQVWVGLSEGKGFAGLLENLTDSYGTTFTAIPPFALIERSESGMRVVVRGDFKLRIDGPDGVVDFDAAGVTTWSERTIEDVRSVQLVTQASPAGEELPVEDAVIGVAELTMGELAQTLPNALLKPEERAQARQEPEHRPGLTQRTLPESERQPEPVRVDDDPSRNLVGVEPNPGFATLGDDPSRTLVTQMTVGGTSNYDQLWATTIEHSVGDAAVRGDNEHDGSGSVPTGVAPSTPPLVTGVPRSGSSASPPPPGSTDSSAEKSALLGDHDGQTISLEQLQQIQGAGVGSGSVPTSRTGAVPGSNDTTGAGTEIGAPQTTVFGRAVLSSGEVVPLDGLVVIGRKPSIKREGNGVTPRLVTVMSPQQDVSRSHVELRYDSGSVLAVDLNTTNGTRLLRAGQEPVRLHPNEPTLMISGDVLDLGDGVMVTMEGLL